MIGVSVGRSRWDPRNKDYDDAHESIIRLQGSDGNLLFKMLEIYKEI